MSFLRQFFAKMPPKMRNRWIEGQPATGVGAEGRGDEELEFGEKEVNRVRACKRRVIFSSCGETRTIY